MLIAKVLKKLRQLDRAGQTVMLHKKTLTITYAEEDRLPEPSGTALAEAIRKHVGHPEEYVNRKSAQLAEVGYGVFTKNLEFTFEHPEIYRDKPIYAPIVDMHLGLLPEIEVSDFELSDVRFDIPIIEKSNHGKPTHIKITPQAQQCVRLVLSTDDFSRRFETSGDLFSTLGNNLIPEEGHAFRIATPNLEVVRRNTEKGPAGKFHVVGMLNEVLHSLVHVRCYAELVELLNYACTEGQRVTLSVKFENREALPLSLDMASLNQEINVKALNFLEDILLVADKARVAPSTEIDLRSLNRVSTLVSAAARHLRGEGVRGQFTISDPNVPYDSTSYGFAGLQMIMVGKCLVYFCVFADETEGEIGFNSSGAQEFSATGETDLHFGPFGKIDPEDVSAVGLSYFLLNALVKRHKDHGHWVIESESSIDRKLQAVLSGQGN